MWLTIVFIFLSVTARIQSTNSPGVYDHQDTCSRCGNLCIVLAEFLNNINKDEAIYTFQTAELASVSWKCHVVRSANQDRARTDSLEKLHEKPVLMVNDWAMKLLPQKSQTDWFGKRGISWHISVVYRHCDGNLQWQGIVHIIQSCSQ